MLSRGSLTFNGITLDDSWNFIVVVESVLEVGPGLKNSLFNFKPSTCPQQTKAFNVSSSRHMWTQLRVLLPKSNVEQ